jgi:hypothetical protein
MKDDQDGQLFVHPSSLILSVVVVFALFPRRAYKRVPAVRDLMDGQRVHLGCCAPFAPA